MKKQQYLIILLIAACCIGWFAIAKIKESQSPVPGWIRYKNNRETEATFELWLPKYYESLDPLVVTLMIQNAADTLGSQYSSLSDDVKIVFAARDTRASNPQTGILISYSASASKTPESALEGIKVRVGNQPNTKLIDSKIELVNNHRTVFVSYDSELEGLAFRHVQYVIFDGNIMWGVLFVPDKDKYEEELSTFEKIVQTFKTQP